MHFSGKYIVNTMKYEVEGNCKKCTVFADGNFNTTIARGRKSQKKISTIEEYLQKNKAELRDLWAEGRYKDMADMFSKISV